MIKIHDVVQGSDEWLKLREGLVTASVAHKLLKGGIESALKKTNFTGNWYTKRGQALEQYAIDAYQDSNMIDALRPGFVTNTDYPLCGVSPDAVTDRNIQVKCFGAEKHLGITEDSIPFETMAQVQFEMMICELPSTDLVLYNPDVDPELALRVIEIRADKTIQDKFKDLLWNTTTN